MKYKLSMYDTNELFVQDFDKPSCLIYRQTPDKFYKNLYIRIVCPEDYVSDLFKTMPNYERACSLTMMIFGQEFIDRSCVESLYFSDTYTSPLIHPDVIHFKCGDAGYFYSACCALPFDCINVLPDYISTFILMHLNEIV